MARSKSTANGVGTDREYSLDEVEFLHAVERWKKQCKRRFPSVCELLAIAVSLGYRKVKPATDLPRPRSIST